MNNIVTKDLKGPARKEIVPTSAPIDKARLQSLVTALGQLGADTTGIQDALQSGTPDEQFNRLAESLNLFLWPDQKAALAQAKPAPAAKEPPRSLIPGGTSAAKNPGVAPGKNPAAPTSALPVRRLSNDHGNVTGKQLVTALKARAAAQPPEPVDGLKVVQQLFGHDVQAAAKAALVDGVNRLARLSQVSPSDKEAANTMWKTNSPRSFQNLLDAKKVP